MHSKALDREPRVELFARQQRPHVREGVATYADVLRQSMDVAQTALQRRTRVDGGPASRRIGGIDDVRCQPGHARGSRPYPGSLEE